MLWQRPLGQTPRKTSHSFTSEQWQQGEARAGGSQERLPWGSGHPSCPWEGGGDRASLGGWGIAGKIRVPMGEGLRVDLKDFGPHDIHAPARVQLEGWTAEGQELLTFAGESLHAGKAMGTGRVCGWESPRGDRVTLSIQILVTCSTPFSQWAGPVATPERPLGVYPGGSLALPISQRSQGLPQAAPRVAQHSERRVAPRRFASQRPSWTFSQQVPLVLSAGEGHLLGPHLHTWTLRGPLPSPLRKDTGPGGGGPWNSMGLGPLT